MKQKVKLNPGTYHQSSGSALAWYVEVKGNGFSSRLSLTAEELGRLLSDRSAAADLEHHGTIATLRPPDLPEK